MEPRNYLANADASPPVKPGAPSVGYPRTATPGVNESTSPGPFWFYKLGEELRALITSAGLTPDDDDLGQVLAAAQGGFGLSKSLAVNGYTTLPGGLIIQWGTDFFSAATSKSITFPITFPNDVLLIDVFDSSASTPGSVQYFGGEVDTTSQMTVWAPASTSTGFNWLALGY